MRGILILLALTASAIAQPRYDYRWGREPLDRVRADLDRAARDMHYLTGSEARRFARAQEEIREFQEKWNRGRFDRGELDDVIGSLQRVVDSNRLRPRDRDLLLDDLARLRDIRARSGGTIAADPGFTRIRARVRCGKLVFGPLPASRRSVHRAPLRRRALRSNARLFPL